MSSQTDLGTPDEAVGTFVRHERRTFVSHMQVMRVEIFRVMFEIAKTCLRSEKWAKKDPGVPK